MFSLEILSLHIPAVSGSNRATVNKNLDFKFGHIFEEPRARLPFKRQGSHRVRDQNTETLTMSGKEMSMCVLGFAEARLGHSNRALLY